MRDFNPNKLAAKVLRILFVEDDVEFAAYLQELIAREITESVEIRHVETVTEAVNLFVVEKQIFDLVLLDIHLPDASGLDAFHKIDVAGSKTPVVNLSNKADDSVALQLIQQGAQDFIEKKSVNPFVLLRTIKFALVRKEMMFLKAELEAARKIQQSLLPLESPEIDGIDVFGAMFPAEDTAGDHFDFLIPIPSMGEGVNGFAMGDVSGHGFGPAMFMAQTCGAINAFSMVETDLSRILHLSNKILLRNNNDLYVSFFLGYIDPETKRVHYASAGHPAYIVTAEKEVVQLRATGTVLGVADTPWENSVSEPLKSGDILVLYTDGWNEAENEGEKQFGNEAFFDIIKQNADKSAKEIVSILQTAVAKHMGDSKQEDDMTIIIVKVE